MDWERLLSTERFRWPPRERNRNGAPSQARNDFERDYDRILFSEPFRRLVDKTQVFPMPIDDHVHNRLVHSLEVASVGRSMGRLVGQALREQAGLAPAHADALGDVVAAACLMHDIGNPPFGHAGEDAIRTWFRGDGQRHVDAFTPAQRADFERFEGNAQSFRIVTRLAMYRERGGMNLTHATLAAACKYPCAAIDSDEASPPDLRSGLISRKKHNFFCGDVERFAMIAGELGLVAHGQRVWSRHPLTFLVEAADDVCYHIMDLEDGFSLGLVDIVTMRALLEPLAKQPARTGDEPRDEVAYLRAMAIGNLIRQAADAFIGQHDRLLAGQLQTPLLRSIPDAEVLREIRRISIQRCYQSTQVERIELVGYEVLGGLLGLLVEAALGVDNGRNARLRRLLPHFDDSLDAYERVLCVTDFVSGMTDRYALRLFRELAGVELSGVRGL